MRLTIDVKDIGVNEGQLAPIPYAELRRSIHANALYYYSQILETDNVRVGGKYHSPWRIDNHPSLQLFYGKQGDGKIFWKDFSTDEYGDVIDLYAKCKNIDISSAVREMASYNEDPFFRSTLHPNDRPKLNPDKPVEIDVTRGNWNIASLSYWHKYGIGLDLLLNYEVYPVKEYICNGRVGFRASFPDNPSYVYKVFNHMKIYSPLRSGGFKWRGNCCNTDIQGFKQLTGNKELIITKSMKDVLVLRRMGYDAIAPQSEKVLLPDVVIQHINASKYYKVYVLFDNDKTGKDGAKAYMKLFPKAKNIEIPANDNGVKDISDMVVKMTFDFAYKWLVTQTTNQLNT